MPYKLHELPVENDAWSVDKHSLQTVLESHHLSFLQQQDASEYRKSVCQKMSCKNITTAIILGLRLGEIQVSDIF